MRQVIVSTYMSLDGKVDEPRDWAIPYDNEGAARYHADLLEGSDGLLLGRRTYEMFAALFPSRSGELPYVDRINSMPKYVASRTLGDLEWENSHLIDGDLAEAVAELKDQPGGHLVVYGGHDLIRALREHGLIDEYRLLVQPVVLGKGRSLFGDGAERMDLELGDTTVISPGVVILTYRLDGRAA